MPSLIAKRLANVKPSPTMAVTTRAAELKAAGKDVIGLGAGEPDFDTPDHIKQAAVEALAKGQTKYTPVGGTPLLKKAVCDKFERENGLTFAPSQIVVGCGAKQLIFNAMLATLNEGDEVIIPAPYWVSYPDMVIFADGKPVFVDCKEEDGFRLKPLELEKAITQKTRWLILNSPSNPTGAAYTEVELAMLAEVLRLHPHVWILADDIYEHLTYDGFTFKTLAQIAPDLAPRILTINGVSKAFSMTGWRIGYAAGPKELITAMADIQSHSTSNACSISQAAAVAALNGPMEFLTEWKKSFAQRRDMVVDALNAIPGVSCLKPEGAFYVYPNIKSLIGKSTASGKKIESCTKFCEYLLEDYLVAAVPGDAFGKGGYFRISYATNEKVLTEACARIRKAVEALK